MPKGDKYIDLTRHLKSCGLDEIEMTFQRVADIVGGLPKSAYQYHAYWSDAMMMRIIIKTGMYKSQSIPLDIKLFIK